VSIDSTDLRNANIEDIVARLATDHERKFDCVVPATAIRAEGGHLQIDGMGYEAMAGLDPAAVGTFNPSPIFQGQLAERFGIPVRYLRALHADRPDLWDANLNGWIHGHQPPMGSPAGGEYGPDPRRFFVRTYTDLEGGPGLARALLSDSFNPIDNTEVLVAALGGIKDSGVEAHVVSGNVSERRMQVRVACPDLAVLAPELLKGYRPTTGGWTVDRAREVAAREGKGYPAGEEPVVFAGFDIGNSEVGDGAYQLTPVCLVQMCANGLTFPLDALRQVHLGGKLGEGRVRWSDDTRKRNSELVRSMSQDAVRTFLDIDYVREQVARIEAMAATGLAEPVKTIERVTKTLGFADDTAQGILQHFVLGGQNTAGGVLNAITAYAQTVPSADTAYDLEAVAVKALALAAA